MATPAGRLLAGNRKEGLEVGRRDQVRTKGEFSAGLESGARRGEGAPLAVGKAHQPMHEEDSWAGPADDSLEPRAFINFPFSVRRPRISLSAEST